MVGKKRFWIAVCSIAVLSIVLIVGIFVSKGRSDPNVRNVFDEMIEKNYVVMEEAEHITAGGYDAVRLLWPVKEGTPLRIGLIYSREAFICKNILEKWFTEHKSSFTKDRLGDLEVLDFLMPYEYCGI